MLKDFSRDSRVSNTTQLANQKSQTYYSLGSSRELPCHASVTFHSASSINIQFLQTGSHAGAGTVGHNRLALHEGILSSTCANLSRSLWHPSPQQYLLHRQRKQSNFCITNWRNKNEIFQTNCKHWLCPLYCKPRQCF